jgi:L,D-peptidoglycan transpeptidase YkuD (ErfK/YbiS/YcfS/YnhG family)
MTDPAASSARDLIVDPAGFALWQGVRLRCALGRGGVRRDKREGDGATPVGSWTMRRLLYRADRLARPETSLPVSVIARQDGWCDAPLDLNYNRPVTLPYPASAESLWREDGVYDLIVPLGYNDADIVSSAGSAIFLHLARPDFSPTEGCVALATADLLGLLRAADATSRVIVNAP